MNMAQLASDLEHALADLPTVDVHTHLVGGKLGARGLHDILLYHMAISDLYAAGCPSGARLTEFPGWPTDEEAHARIHEALPYLPLVRNTSSSWAMRIILGDLYDWHEPITADNWKRLDAIVRERADDRVAHHAILDRLKIERTGTELARRGSGEDDHRLQYALEWGFFTRCQWGEYDTALYELERCWGRSPESPVFQFSFGAEPLPYETASRLSQRSIAQLAEMIGRHPKLQFQSFLASRHANQSLATLARELPNLSLAGYWWHNFFPDVIRQVMAERLDMLPVTKQVGFFSDAYCVEWTYAKAILTRKQLAQVLAEKISQGQYDRNLALSIAQAILYDTPQTLLGMIPRST